MRVNLKRVIAAWEAGKACERERSIWTDGTSIYSYGTCIAAPMIDGRMVLNVTKYSATTSNKQSDLAWALGLRLACKVDDVRQGASPGELIEKANTLAAAAERAARIMGVAV